MCVIKLFNVCKNNSFSAHLYSEVTRPKRSSSVKYMYFFLAPPGALGEAIFFAPVGSKKCKGVLESLNKLYCILEPCPGRSCSNSKRFNSWVLLELVNIM